jgi:hypothetical protein
MPLLVNCTPNASVLTERGLTISVRGNRYQGCDDLGANHFGGTCKFIQLLQKDLP